MSAETDPARLLRAIRQLELVARRDAVDWRHGDYATAIRGSGLRFRENRKYVAGEPARHIDWNVTARLGEPYVKVFDEERQRETLLALDVSPSMDAGFRRRTKLELGVELAATLAVAASEAGDRVGLVVFADRVRESLPPRPGRGHLYRILGRLLAHAAAGSEPRPEVTDPRTALHEVQRRRGRRRVVFLISDFIDHDVPEDLRYVQARHDVSLLHVYDPFEFAEDSPLRLPMTTGEGRAAPTTAAPGGDLAAARRRLSATAHRYRATYEAFATTEDLRPQLGAFLHRKRQRLAAAPA